MSACDAESVVILHVLHLRACCEVVPSCGQHSCPGDATCCVPSSLPAHRRCLHTAALRACAPRPSYMYAHTHPLQTKSGGGLKDPKSKSAKREVNLPYKTREALEKLIPAIIFTYIYPRLDIEVSKHRNHLLKAPFCIHPKTGRVCVPIDITALDDFDPAEVPVLPDIMEEGMAFARSSAGSAAAAAGSIGGLDSTLWEQTSVSPYRQQFREFVDNMHEGIRRQRREAAARAEARFADF